MEEVDSVAQVLIERGIAILEVPIRTRDAASSDIEDEALRCIEHLKVRYEKSAFVVAGTVMQPSDIEVLKKLDVSVALSIGLNDEVVVSAVEQGISFLPGVETVSEAVRAVNLGADGLKVFPAVCGESNGEYSVRHPPGFIKYLSKFVSCPIIASGELLFASLPKAFLAAGASGINLGAQLYQPGIDPKEFVSRADRVIVSVGPGDATGVRSDPLAERA